MDDMGAFREAVLAWAARDAAAGERAAAGRTAGRAVMSDFVAGDPGGPARELAARLPVRTVVLLEGLSDVAAVDALAERRGRDLAAEGVCVLPIGGAMSVGRFARLLGPSGLDLRLVGLCDERERDYYARALAGAGEQGRTAGLSGAGEQGRTAGLSGAVEQGRAAGLSGAGEQGRAKEGAGSGEQGFFVCAADLEDELIRALGVTRVTELVRAEGEERPLRTFLRQPAQQGRPPHLQLRRFFGTKKGRKIRYGRVLVEALDPDRVPAPLERLFAGL
ncbi:TOPRIM nucleotidyl transferase/hydrolase domain-containing protein [Streptomyces sp. NPDC101158]|uniref:TOPRIM nucleotidyl transferase/hydrolase domain-containing protein n=1 Tax=Streptomyces sp. NPDC101158 TaxID=3366117 RepID=UPI003824BDE5